MDDAVRELAREAGIANEWIDAADKPQRVSVETLRSILTALELPCATKADIAESRARLREQAGRSRTFFTATAGSAIPLPGLPADAAAELVLEGGERQPVALSAQDGGAVMPPIDTPGYHRLYVGEREVTLAVAPARCVTLRGHRAGRKIVGARRSALFAAARGRSRLWRHGGAARTCRDCRARGLRRDCLEPDAQPVWRRQHALRPLFAVEPAVPQSALRRSRNRVRAEACRDARARHVRASTTRHPDRLATGSRSQVCAAAAPVG